VYLTYPFVASWSLREAMAAGCAIVASDTAPVREFVTHRRTGLLAPFLEPRTIAERVLEVLEDGKLSQRLRRGARAWAEANLDMDDYLAAYRALIERTLAQGGRV
jgi:glycosyltransferase involved in cell wall biosynthesis